MAAVIIRGGSVLSVGFNRIEVHPAAYFGCSFHAEHDAIRKASGDVAGAKMFVYRFGRSDGHVRTSKPCLICQQKIAKAGISSAIFLDSDGIVKRESFKASDISSLHSMHLYVNDANCYER